VADRTTALLIGLGAVGLLGLAVSGGGGGSRFDVDLIGQSPKSKRKSTRRWKAITGITLHQVGVSNMGRSAWPKVTAHLGVHTDGTVYRIHPMRSYLWHGHKLNRDTIGIEVAGNFLGDENDLNSYWKNGGGPDRLNSAQRAGIHKAVRYAMSTVKKNGGKIKYIYAHRQASGDRGVDPGDEIWRAGGLWAQKRFGLTEGGCDYTRGSGRGIPGAWDPSCATPEQTVSAEEPGPSHESEGAEFPG